MRACERNEEHAAPTPSIADLNVVHSTIYGRCPAGGSRFAAPGLVPGSVFRASRPRPVNFVFGVACRIPPSRDISVHPSTHATVAVVRTEAGTGAPRPVKNTEEHRTPPNGSIRRLRPIYLRGNRQSESCAGRAAEILSAGVYPKTLWVSSYNI